MNPVVLTLVFWVAVIVGAILAGLVGLLWVLAAGVALLVVSALLAGLP